MSHIRNMAQNDIPFAVDLAQSEGWRSETADEFNAFLTYHPEGCFIIEVNGQKAGMCVVVPYKKDGYFSEFIILKKFRNQGAGAKLLDHAIQHLVHIGIKSIYLDGMPKATALYQRAGFRKIGRSTRWTGHIKYKPSSEIHPVTESDIKQIIQIDKVLFKCDRSFFLKYIWKRNQETSKLIKKNGQIVGYIFGKIRGSEFNIGPWICLGEPEEAQILLQSISPRLNELQVRIGVYDTHSESMTLLENLGLTKQANSPWHMVRGEDTKLGDSEYIYGIGSAAKG